MKLLARQFGVIAAASILLGPPTRVAWARQGTGISPRGTYLIVHPPELDAAARRWARYRESDRWLVHQTLAPAGKPDVVRRAVTQAIADRHAEHVGGGRPGTFMVLLLGDADAIPPFQYRQHDLVLRDPQDPWYVTDHPYQRLDLADDLPDVALGRVPARTVDDALAVLIKVQGYEREAPPGPWRRRINYAAGEGRFGGLDILIEMLFRGMLARMVPDRFDASMTYAKPGSVFCPPPQRLNDELLRRLGEGSLLFNYVGHGSARHLDRLSLPDGDLTLLHNDDLQRLPESGHRLPIALLACCSAGWFDLPGDDRCLAEAMLLNPNGPVAVIAGSRPTHPYANAVLQKDVTELLLMRRISTVGELDLLASRSMVQTDVTDRQIDMIAAPLALTGGWETSLRGLRHMHLRLYNLLGDPATRIAHPDSEVTGLTAAGGRVRGRAGRLRSGTISITVETDLTSSGLPAADGGAAWSATEAYDRVNDRVLLRLEGPVGDGVFDVPLSQSLPPDSALIKAYAVGTDEKGRAVDAFGAVRLAPGAGAIPTIK